MDQQPQTPKAEAATDTDQKKTGSPTQAPNPKPDPIHSPHGDGHNWANFVMSSEPEKNENQAQAQAQPQIKTEPSPASSGSHKSVHWRPELETQSHSPNIRNYDNTMPSVDGSYPSPPSNSFSFRDAVGNVKDVLGRWGKKVGDASKKAEDLAGNTWQHLKTSPSFTDAAMGRIAQGTKVLAEGGYEKIFRRTFETVPEEELLDSYACYLSTSAGPVMGILYVSTEKLAFCSDNPLSYKSGGQTEWSYYKVVIPLHQLRAVNPSSSRNNAAEKYVQVISIDNHEFWFMGFLNYGSAMECLQGALDARNLE